MHLATALFALTLFASGVHGSRRSICGKEGCSISDIPALEDRSACGLAADLDPAIALCDPDRLLAEDEAATLAITLANIRYRRNEFADSIPSLCTGQARLGYQVGLLVVSRLAREEKGTSHPAHEVSRGLARDLMGHWALGDEGCDDGVVWVLEARPEGLPRPAMTSVAGEGAAAHLLERELAGISDAFDQDLQAGKSLGRAALLALQRTARCLSQDCHRSRGHGWRLPDDPGPFRVPPMLLALGSLALGAAMALVAMNRPVKPPRAPRAPVFKIAVREESVREEVDRAIARDVEGGGSRRKIVVEEEAEGAEGAAGAGRASGTASPAHGGAERGREGAVEEQGARVQRGGRKGATGELRLRAAAE